MILRAVKSLFLLSMKMSSHSSEIYYINRRHINPAAERNKAPILEILRMYMISPQTTPPVHQVLLEISSGSGQHVSYFAKHFQWITFQPTEFEMSSFESINGYIQYEKLENVKPPGYLDVRDPACSWLGGNIKNESIDYVLNINMMHISEYKCAEGLFTGCSEILKPGGYLFTYGPYAFDGEITPESNVRFNAMLRSQDPSWGLRDLPRQLVPLASSCGIRLVQVHPMPANNHLVIWQKAPGP
ncbi:methyltransferase-like 26 [Nilaparvata lugens]|uniref:methyltransferase-like 26 n=1 Tax=Nilaparvata lugens TaxID=108931 RepID=UPI00193E1F1F|nr:methyltransferase-like 26 [Nilaparvata lugens]XP_022201935.2 methyltransferase-like 26 [Nilaparvata lugens]